MQPGTTLSTTPETAGKLKPKRLHFPTPLTAREDEHHPAQAMTPSQAAGTMLSSAAEAQPDENKPQDECPNSSQEREEEESPTTDGEMQVDFF